MTRPTHLAGILCLSLVLGCAGWRGVAHAPDDHQIVLDQLVVISNFPLPSKHRLLEDLRAERSLVSETLALPVSDEPIHVQLFETADELHLYAKSQFPGVADRRAFFVETDTQLKVYAYWGDRVAEDLRHEVAHGYLHAVVRNLPLWLDEGLAEYFEVPRGHHGFNAPHAELLRNSQSRGWKPDLRRLEALHDATEMTQLDYAESWAWLHWLLETATEHKTFLQQFVSRLRQQGEIEPLSLALRQMHLDYEQQLSQHVMNLGRREVRREE
jgi:hypothetical protein